MELSEATGEGTHAVLFGFTHLVKLFETVRDILSTEAYLPCLRGVERHSSSLGLQVMARSTLLCPRHEPERVSSAQRLEIAQEILAQLARSVDPVSTHPGLSSSHRGLDMATATVNLTCLYLSNLFVDNIFTSMSNSSQASIITESADHQASPTVAQPPHSGYEEAVWSIRESIARKVLDVLQKTPTEILELNGFSLVSPPDRYKN